MPIETFPNNGSADKAGKWKERELQIFNPSPSESNLGRGKKKSKNPFPICNEYVLTILKLLGKH